MKYKYELSEVDCANCAAKMEEAIAKIDGVEEATINFMAQKLILVADENRIDEILQEAQKRISKIEKDCEIIIK